MVVSTRSIIQQVAAVLLVVLTRVASAADVSVSIQPQEFPVGRGGQLSIKAEGGNFDRPPNVPTPPGVSIRSYGQSRNVQIINGRMSQSITQNYLISADKPGDYTIPSFEVEIGGQRLTTDPVNFRVTASAVPAPQPGNPSSTSGAAQQVTSFMRLDFPERDHDHLYVGEMAPVRIKAYFPENTRVSLRSAPRPEGKGFTLHNLSDQPKQDVEVYKGQRYRTVTWFAGVSVAKAGEYPISVGLDATVMVPDPSSRGRRGSSPLDSFFGGNSPFNDPFFDNFFDSAFTRTIPKEVTLTSPGDPLTIRSLPTEGRPENFTGAVGEFSLGGYRLPAEAKTGEPQKIRVVVNGKGNFDRLGAPVLEPADDWKTYQPKTEFSPGDVASFSGTKTFDFNAVPQKSGDQSLSLSFSYFDPDKESYQTVTSEQINLAVTGADVVPDAAPVAGGQAAAAAVEQDSKPATELAPNRKVSGRFVSLSPLIYSGSYWAMVCIASLGIASGFVLAALQKRNNDPARLAVIKAEKQQSAALSQVDETILSGDAAGFFIAARKALQEYYGSLWQREAGAITISELRDKLPEDSPAIELFQRADELAYAPATELDASDLQGWNAKLQEAMES